jgi:hypothetical protein
MSDRAAWTDAKREYLVVLVREQVLRGKTSDSGLKAEAWMAILGKFNEKFRDNMKRQQLQNAFSRLKTDYSVFCFRIDSITSRTTKVMVSPLCWKRSCASALVLLPMM